MSIDLQTIRELVEIARVGSINKAAQNLFKSQSSLSKNLRQIEQKMGCTLFIRTGSGVQPTLEGKKFLRVAENIMLQFDNIQAILNNEKYIKDRQLRIAFMSCHLLQPLLENFNRINGTRGLSVKCYECGIIQGIELLENNKVDLLISGFKDTYDITHMIKQLMMQSNIEYHHIGWLYPYIGVSENSRLYPKEINYVDYERLSKMPLIFTGLAPLSPYDEEISGWKWFRSLSASPEKVVSSGVEYAHNNIYTVTQMVKRLDGFTLPLLLENYYKWNPYCEGIRLIPMGNDSNRRYNFGYFQNTNVKPSYIAEEFIESVKSHLLK